MKNKGFTLAEILGVIVIIGLLVTLVMPTITNRIRANSSKAEKASNQIIFDAALQYINENKQDFSSGKKHCISISTLIDEGKLASPVKNIKTNEKIDDTHSVLVTIDKTGNISFDLILKNTCERDIKS